MFLTTTFPMSTKLDNIIKLLLFMSSLNNGSIGLSQSFVGKTYFLILIYWYEFLSMTFYFKLI